MYKKSNNIKNILEKIINQKKYKLKVLDKKNIFNSMYIGKSNYKHYHEHICTYILYT